MEINGLQLAFLDIPPEYTQEYNRWYDLDHMPEHVAKDDVVMGRRYVAQRTLQGLPGSQEGDFGGGHAPYLTIYFFGGPLDLMSEEAREGWRTLDRGIVKQGRYWLAGKGVGGGMFRLGEPIGRPSVLTLPRAIPHLNHRGVIVALGKAPSAERRQEAIDWWRDVHLVDLFGSVPGLLAALRCDPVDPESDQVLHVLYCEDPVTEVMAGIEAAKRYAGAVGRWPAYGGVYEPLAFLPYDRIVPLEYDFDFGTD